MAARSGGQLDFLRLREGFAGKGMLLTGKISSAVERLCYFSAYNFLKSTKREGVVWVSTDYSYEKVVEMFGDYGYNIKPYLSRFYFVDLISIKSGAKDCDIKGVKCVQDPGNLTELSLAIGEHLEGAKCGMLVIHLLNSLLIYNELARALEFIRITDALAFEKKFAFVAAYIEGEHDEKARVAIEISMDVIGKVEGQNLHIITPIEVQSFSFSLMKGGLKLEKAEVKRTREQMNI